MDAISLSFHKEMAKEREPKGLEPFGNPQNLFLSLSFGGYQKALSHLQSLRRQIQRFASYCKQARIFYCVFCRAIRATETGSEEFCPKVSAAFYNRLLRNQKFCICASHDARFQRANKTSIFRRRRNGRSQKLKMHIFASCCAERERSAH